MRTTWITPGFLALLTGAYILLLMAAPFWIGFIPCVILAHRIGILLHEFIHGIPFKYYRDNNNVVTLFDGFFLTFGLLEVFRATHLAHHRWLNTPLDPALESDGRARAQGLWATIKGLVVFEMFEYLRQAFAGEKPYVRRWRIVSAFVISTVVIIVLASTGHGLTVWKILAVTLYTTMVPVSFRSAVEHYSYPGDPGFANEYKVWIPMFNLNRHVHHHEEPRTPWYRLQFRTGKPLSNVHYFTHWFRVYATREYVPMQPPAPTKDRTKAEKGPTAI